MLKKDLKIVFMGTPVFAKESLKALVDNKYNISLVMAQPDRQSGRGMKMTFPPVKEYALEQGLEVYQPEKIRGNDEVINKLKDINPDIIIVVAYGKILPQFILDIPKYGCINVHGSLLPKFRGAAPIQRCIIDGEKVTGITTMYMDAGMDTGDMIYKREIEIDEKDTYNTLHDKLMVVGAEILVDTIDKFILLEGNLPREKQGDDFTIAPMIDDKVAQIDFNNKGKDIVNKIRGLNMIPGAFTKIDEDRQYKIYEAVYYNYDNILDLNIEIDSNNKKHINGQIVHLNDRKDLMIVKCSDGYINILKLKPKNKGIMAVGDYIRGGKIAVGDMFVI